jgi:hypothetical protein
MSAEEEKRQAGLKLLKRLIPLAVLGAVVALVVGQITRMITHDVLLTVEMTPGLADGLEKVELTITDEDREIVSVTVFQLDETTRSDRKLTHKLNLTAGKYDLAFKFMASGGSPRAVINRPLEVSGDTAVSLNLP